MSTLVLDPKDIPDFDTWLKSVRMRIVRPSLLHDRMMEQIAFDAKLTAAAKKLADARKTETTYEAMAKDDAYKLGQSTEKSLRSVACYEALQLREQAIERNYPEYEEESPSYKRARAAYRAQLTKQLGLHQLDRTANFAMGPKRPRGNGTPGGGTPGDSAPAAAPK